MLNVIHFNANSKVPILKVIKKCLRTNTKNKYKYDIKANELKLK